VKISIGQVEIDILNGAKITYDSNTDTISIEPPHPIQRHAQPVKTSPKEKPLMIEHDKSQIPTTKTELTNSVMRVLRSAGIPVSGMSLTMQCLGPNSGANKIKYLKLLLEEMVNEGRLVQSHENGRSRFQLA
jgi:hypothetical protein